jgi:hypothetical protein
MIRQILILTILRLVFLMMTFLTIVNIRFGKSRFFTIKWYNTYNNCYEIIIPFGLVLFFIFLCLTYLIGKKIDRLEKLDTEYDNFLKD